MALAVAALAVALALVATPALVHSGAVTDKYVPFCPSYADPPPSGTPPAAPCPPFLESPGSELGLLGFLC